MYGPYVAILLMCVSRNTRRVDFCRLTGSQRTPRVWGVTYSDADFGGYKIDRKSTGGTCHFLGHSLVSWHSKKQNSVALSTAEAEYIVAGLGCAQVLWMKQTLSDFGLTYSHVPIKCEYTSAISISKNLVQHYRD